MNIGYGWAHWVISPYYKFISFSFRLINRKYDDGVMKYTGEGEFWTDDTETSERVVGKVEAWISLIPIILFIVLMDAPSDYYEWGYITDIQQFALTSLIGFFFIAALFAMMDSVHINRGDSE